MAQNAFGIRMFSCVDDVQFFFYSLSFNLPSLFFFDVDLVKSGLVIVVSKSHSVGERMSDEYVHVCAVYTVHAISHLEVFV